MMNGNRRRKKRPSYGIRTIDITKGINGFGFTISGQEPCILSCIVPSSPAEKAGLRPGDYLIAVNGQNVSKTPHDDVVRFIGLSKVLKLQIAENYYSDSSDEEFSLSRPKSKYPHRLKHKYQQTRAEKVVRDLQSGAIFSEHTAIHNSENASFFEQEWTDSYPECNPYSSKALSGSVPNSLMSSSSPTLLQPDQIRLAAGDVHSLAVASNNHLTLNDTQIQKEKLSPKKREKILKGGGTITAQCEHESSNQRQFHKKNPKEALPKKQNFTPEYSTGLYLHNTWQSEKPIARKTYDLLIKANQESVIASSLHKCHNDPLLCEKGRNSYLEQVPRQISPLHMQQLVSQVRRQSPAKLLQLNLATNMTLVPGDGAVGQEVNDILFPTTSEFQGHQVSQNVEEIYRAVVGYLGTIEMPKEHQGGSRLSAIRNCIRRLRIEKKVHTLVMMSIFSEEVVLTNIHGLTLAKYPSERITFCGAYADDKKFFGLVTAHGTSNDEISEDSQDEGDPRASVSSSCHVFMVDPNAVQHPNHCRRAKNFGIDCTPIVSEGEGVPRCKEFPESAEPILHSIMSLYRNSLGFHIEAGAPGLIDVDHQMSPPHSNSSSNSSNSDSGIGFRDEGAHSYNESERVFIMEYENNQRTRLKNVHLIGGRLTFDTENPSGNLRNKIMTLGDTSDSSLPSTAKAKVGLSEKFAVLSRVRPASCDNSRTSCQGIFDFKRPFRDCTNELRNERQEISAMKNKFKATGNRVVSSGRMSVTDELRARKTPDFSKERPSSVTPGRECKSPSNDDRLTVRAMPDPITFQQSPGLFPSGEFAAQVSFMRHSMSNYLEHKQEHLVKQSHKINLKESDSDRPVPSHVRKLSTCTESLSTSTPLSLKLSPKVYGVPFWPSVPSEHSFTRSLEDLRGDSSTSESVGAGCCHGSESDHGLPRLLSSESDLVRCGSGRRSKGAFRSAFPRPHLDIPPKGKIPYLGRIRNIGKSFDSCETAVEEQMHLLAGERSSSGDISNDSDQVEGEEGKRQGGVSLRHLTRSRKAKDRVASTYSDTELGKNSSDPSICVSSGDLSGGSTPLQLSRVGAWAASFEKLIEDPAGLHTFVEFLKKEYSHENIYFWTACERFKTIEDREERLQVAKNIFNRHLGVGAPEPVNVDSHARQVAQEGLNDPTDSIFLAAQKQIFNLMKFDSYSRFLKSDLYNKCLVQDRKGLALPFPGDDTLDPELGIFSDSSFYTNLKKSKSDADDRRRKSLLPWNRKDRSKSKDRGEAEYWRKKKLGYPSTSDSSSVRSDLTGSHTSINSSDFVPARRAISKESLTSLDAVSLSGAEGYNLCRFILPDQSNSVLALKSGETINEVVKQLLEKRRLNFTSFNVLVTKGDNKVIDLSKDSTLLGGMEVVVERVVLFSLHLPCRKTVYVKAKQHKLISDVLKPILNKYNLKMDLVVINKNGETKGINLKGPVTELDGEKLIIQTKDEVKEWSDPGRSNTRRNNTLDEITNRVFEDLLNGKSQSNFDDLGVLDFDARSSKTDPTSETSSGVVESFSRKESLSLERNWNTRQSLGVGRGGAEGSKGNENIKAKKQHENDSYDGLKRAQTSRLDDQRGTEINFELPDFLKTDPKHLDLLFNQSFITTSSESANESEFFSKAHPEVWGGEITNTSAENTLLCSTSMDLEETLQPHPSFSDGDKENIATDFSAAISEADSLTKGLTPSSSLTQIVSNSSSILLSLQPPPLPPKPKLGGPFRCPPPRPVSRPPMPLCSSLRNINSTSCLNNSVQNMDKFNVSFV